MRKKPKKGKKKVAKVWILYFKRGERWEHNNRDGADRIAVQFGKLQAFFAKPDLLFGNESDIPPYGDEESSLIDMTVIMDNGTQLNLQCIIDRKVSDVEVP